MKKGSVKKALLYVLDRPWLGLAVTPPLLIWAAWSYTTATNECEKANGELYRSFFAGEQVCVKPSGIIWRR